MLGSSIQISYTGGNYLPLSGGTLTGDLTISTTKAIIAGATTSEYSLFKAFDTGVGMVEIGRLAGAADPYFQIGRDDTGVATNAVTDALVIQCGAGTNNEAAGQGLGISFKLGNAASEVEERASLDAVLITATNGAEEAAFKLNLMVAGAMVNPTMIKGEASKLKFCQDYFQVRNITDTDWGLFYAGTCFQNTITGNIDGAEIAASGVDGHYMFLKARDTGVGSVEIGRFQGAADPYFQVGRDDTGVALNAVTDMLVLQAGGGSGNETTNFGLGISFKLGNASSEVEERGSIDLVLVDATNASEDTRLNFNLQIAGAAPALVGSLTGTGPIFPLLPSADPAVAGMLYYIAATGVVMRSAG